MEVLAISTNFHDTNVKWKIRQVEGKFSLLLGSEKDRIQIVFDNEELEQFFAQYAESKLVDAEWISPVE